MKDPQPKNPWRRTALLLVACNVVLVFSLVLQHFVIENARARADANMKALEKSTEALRGLLDSDARLEQAADELRRSCNERLNRLMQSDP